MTTDKKTPGKKVPGLSIASRTASFRRAGLGFTAEPRLVPLAELTKEQLAALRAESMLIVTDVQIDAPADAA